MTSRLDELLKVLDEIIQLLEADGEQLWSNWLRQSRDWLLNSDFAGIEHLLSAYGGMGSFNDLIIIQNKEGYVEINNKLDNLRRQAWELADQIRRDHLSDS